MEKKYSGKKIIKAGETLLIPNLEGINKDLFSSSMDILSYWRFTHEVPLKAASEKLQLVSRDIDAASIFAKRLKRHPSIVSKLRRFSTMKLKNMQDIGGCRAIVSNEKKLRKIVKELKKHPEFIYEQNKNKNKYKYKYKYKDYLKDPKDDGYKGYHLIGLFNDENGDKKSIEIQVRTRIQHYWATALEIVDLFTGQALKSNLGDQAWKDFFSSASQQFSIIESISAFDGKTFDEQVLSYIKALEVKGYKEAYSHKFCQYHIKKLDIFQKLNAFASSLKIIDSKLEGLDKGQTVGFILLQIDILEKQVVADIFSDSSSKEAEIAYIDAEKDAATKKGRIVALVSSTSVGGIKEAYPNYFADSTQFLELMQVINSINNSIQLKTKEKLSIEM